MGSTLSALKAPLSYLSGEGESVEWRETESTFVLRVSAPQTRKGVPVSVELVECPGRVMKLRISGQLASTGKTFTKLIKLPQDGGLLHRTYVNVDDDDASLVVTVPKAEEV